MKQMQCVASPHRTMSHRLRLASGVCLCAIAMATGAMVNAQTVYRSVGPDGRVTFSDKPPVVATKVTAQDASGKEAGSAGANLPYELAQVSAKFPVTLYTSAACAPCDDGRALLRTRGIPFSEKTVSTAEDAQSLKSLSDSSSLPLLTIGGQQLKGFSAPEWGQYLSAAGYPAKSQLPTGYRAPPASPLVTVHAPTATTPAVAAPDNAPQPNRVVPRPATSPGNPAGIQF